MSGLALILYHKQATSARLRFARFGDTVVAARGEAVGGRNGGIDTHPGPLASTAAARLGLGSAALRIDPEFRALMLTTGGTATVWIAEFTAIDPPFEAVEAAGGRFVNLTELRGIPDPERDVMRLVYEHVLGG